MEQPGHGFILFNHKINNNCHSFIITDSLTPKGYSSDTPSFATIADALRAREII
jgi:hypothetical protein